MISSPYKVLLDYQESAEAHGSIRQRLPHANPCNAAASCSPRALCSPAPLRSFARTPSAIPRRIPVCASLSTRPAACSALLGFRGTVGSQTSPSTSAPGPSPLPTPPIARPNFQKTILHPPAHGWRCLPPSPNNRAPSACIRFPWFQAVPVSWPRPRFLDGNSRTSTPALPAAWLLSSTHTNAASGSLARALLPCLLLFLSSKKLRRDFFPAKFVRQHRRHSARRNRRCDQHCCSRHTCRAHKFLLQAHYADSAFCIKGGGSSALGPQLAGTATSSIRRYTLNCPRCWYQWLSITFRRNSPRGCAKSSRPPETMRQLSFIAASSNFGNMLRTVAMLSSRVLRISSRLAGCGKLNDSGACAGLFCTK